MRLLEVRSYTLERIYVLDEENWEGRGGNGENRALEQLVHVGHLEGVVPHEVAVHGDAFDGDLACFVNPARDVLASA